MVRSRKTNSELAAEIEELKGRLHSWEGGADTHGGTRSSAGPDGDAPSGVLAQKEKLLRLALSSGGLAMWDWNIAERKVVWNEELFRMLGYAVGEVTPGFSAWVERIHPEDRQEIEAAAHQAFLQSEECEVRFRSLWPDGTVHWLEAKGCLERDHEGGAVHCYGVMNDVSSRHVADELLQTDEHFRLLLNHVPSLVFLKDGAGRYVYLNQAYETRFVRGRNWVGKTDFDFWDRRSAELFQANDAEVLRSDRVHQFMEDSRDLTGARYCWLCYKFPFTDSRGRRYLGGVGIDATDWILAQEALQKNEERLHLATSAGRVMVYDLHVTSSRIHALHGLTELLGYDMPKEEFTLQQWDNLIYPDDLTAFHEAFHKMHTRTHDHAICYRVRDKAGRLLWVEDRSTPVFGKAGKVERLIGTVRDITWHKQAEQSLRDMNEELEKRVAERTTRLTAINKELRSFCYSVTHELGAPLRSMNAFSSILLEEHAGRLDSEGRNYLKRIACAATRLGHLVEDLLRLSRVTRRTLVRQTVDLSAIAQEIVTGLAEQDPTRRVQVEIPCGVRGDWDRELITLVLQNLLSNAWKYTAGKSGARIEFGCCSKGSKQVFFVRDNGIGFDMAYAGKIFLPFERLHRNGEYEGTGVGLAIVQRVIDLHGGRIWTKAVPGKGAAFYFTSEGASALAGGRFVSQEKP